MLPVPLFVKQVPFRDAPSLFYWFPRDMRPSRWCVDRHRTFVLVITGLARTVHVVIDRSWAAIYLLYLSFVNVGQTFYALAGNRFCWKLFFAIFLGGSQSMPQAVPIWLFRWLLFRIMFGAGLIKLRGDPCWRDLTCLDYHYETQPMPNPLSWYFHWAPQWMNRGGVLFNHFSELIVPFVLFPAAADRGNRRASSRSCSKLIDHRQRKSFVAELADAVSGVLPARCRSSFGCSSLRAPAMHASRAAAALAQCRRSRFSSLS